MNWISFIFIDFAFTFIGFSFTLIRFALISNAFESILIDLCKVSKELIENNVISYYGNWAGIRAGTSRTVLDTSILSWTQPSKIKYWTFILIVRSSTPLKILFFQNFLFHPKFSNPYCRKGSSGPYGPFWLSARKWFW